MHSIKLKVMVKKLYN